MAIRTPFTELFGVDHPLLLAPMGGVSGGALAAAVSEAGGLGLVGGGYGDPRWLERELRLVAGATGKPWGVGVITWAVGADIVRLALSYRPAAVFLSFGDPAPFGALVREAGIKLICQVQDVAGARQAAAASRELGRLEHSIRLSAGSGGTTSVSSTGFLPRHPVKLAIDGTVITTLTADDLGVVSYPLNPAALGLKPGHHVLTLQGMLITTTASFRS